MWNDTTLNRAVQQSIYQICQDGNYDWPFNDNVNTTATVVSTATYTLPTNFVRLEMGTAKWNGSNLVPADYRVIVNNYSNLAVDGTPSYCYLRGSNIGLFPRPNAIQNLTYLYRSKLADFTDDTTDDGIPNEFIEAVVQYACFLLWSDLEGKNDRAIECLQSYKQAMEGLFDQFLGRREESNFQAQFETAPVWGSRIYYT